MRLRNIKDKDIILENCPLIIKEPKNIKDTWHKYFNNNNPIHLEIGSGLCGFIIKMAKEYRNINFIGIEKQNIALAKGIKDLSEINNLKLINIDAKELNEIFSKEIDTIYLNFSDPWPKARHEKRRLTSKEFLKIYDNLFKNSKTIIMKTDNRELFEYSISSLSNYGYIINNIKTDLHNSNISDNIFTEYEEKFTSIGIKIYYIKAIKD